MKFIPVLCPLDPTSDVCLQGDCGFRSTKVTNTSAADETTGPLLYDERRAEDLKRNKKE